MSGRISPRVEFRVLMFKSFGSQEKWANLLDADINQLHLSWAKTLDQIKKKLSSCDQWLSIKIDSAKLSRRLILAISLPELH